MVETQSLGAILDHVNEKLFYKQAISVSEKQSVTAWLAGRQIRSGPMAGMFAPTGKDNQGDFRLFTGEKPQTRLLFRNTLTTETARLLALLGNGNQVTLERTNAWLLRQCFAKDYCVIGECAHSGVGWMRYLVVNGLSDATERLEKHITVLAQRRDGKGRWQGFPFYYTLLALSEISLPAATAELHYALPACERALRRSSEMDKYTQRRRAIVERILNQ